MKTDSLLAHLLSGGKLEFDRESYEKRQAEKKRQKLSEGARICLERGHDWEDSAIQGNESFTRQWCRRCDAERTI